MAEIPWTLRALRALHLQTAQNRPPLSPSGLLRDPIRISAATPTFGRTLAGLSRKRRAQGQCHAALAARSAMAAVRCGDWPRLGEGLLQPCRLANKLRHPPLPRPEWDCRQRFVAGGAPANRRRGHHRQDPSPPSGVWNHGRKRRLWRLPAAARFDCAHRWLILRRGRERAGRLGGFRHEGPPPPRPPPPPPPPPGTDTGGSGPRACSARRFGRLSRLHQTAQAIGMAVRTWPSPSTPWAVSFAISKTRPCSPLFLRRTNLPRSCHARSSHMSHDAGFSTIATRKSRSIFSPPSANSSRSACVRRPD